MPEDSQREVAVESGIREAPVSGTIQDTHESFRKLMNSEGTESNVDHLDKQGGKNQSRSKLSSMPGKSVSPLE